MKLKRQLKRGLSLLIVLLMIVGNLNTVFLYADIPDFELEDGVESTTTSGESTTSDESTTSGESTTSDESITSGESTSSGTSTSYNESTTSDDSSSSGTNEDNVPAEVVFQPFMLSVQIMDTLVPFTNILVLMDGVEIGRTDNNGMIEVLIETEGIHVLESGDLELCEFNEAFEVGFSAEGGIEIHMVGENITGNLAEGLKVYAVKLLTDLEGTEDFGNGILAALLAQALTVEIDVRYDDTYDFNDGTVNYTLRVNNTNSPSKVNGNTLTVDEIGTYVLATNTLGITGIPTVTFEATDDDGIVLVSPVTGVKYDETTGILTIIKEFPKFDLNIAMVYEDDTTDPVTAGMFTLTVDGLPVTPKSAGVFEITEPGDYELTSIVLGISNSITFTVNPNGLDISTIDPTAAVWNHASSTLEIVKEFQPFNLTFNVMTDELIPVAGVTLSAGMFKLTGPEGYDVAISGSEFNVAAIAVPGDYTLTLLDTSSATYGIKSTINFKVNHNGTITVANDAGGKSTVLHKFTIIQAAVKDVHIMPFVAVAATVPATKVATFILTGIGGLSKTINTSADHGYPTVTPILTKTELPGLGEDRDYTITTTTPGTYIGLVDTVEFNIAIDKDTGMATFTIKAPPSLPEGIFAPSGQSLYLEFEKTTEPVPVEFTLQVGGQPIDGSEKFTVTVPSTDVVVPTIANASGKLTFTGAKNVTYTLEMNGGYSQLSGVKILVVIDGTGGVTIKADGATAAPASNNGTLNITSITPYTPKPIYIGIDDAEGPIKNQPEFTVTSPTDGPTISNVKLGADGKLTLDIPPNTAGYKYYAGDYTLKNYVHGIVVITIDEAGNIKNVRRAIEKPAGGTDYYSFVEATGLYSGVTLDKSKIYVSEATIVLNDPTDKDVNTIYVDMLKYINDEFLPDTTTATYTLVRPGYEKPLPISEASPGKIKIPTYNTESAGGVYILTSSDPNISPIHITLNALGNITTVSSGTEVKKITTTTPEIYLVDFYAHGDYKSAAVSMGSIDTTAINAINAAQVDLFKWSMQIVSPTASERPNGYYAGDKITVKFSLVAKNLTELGGKITEQQYKDALELAYTKGFTFTLDPNLFVELTPPLVDIPFKNTWYSNPSFAQFISIGAGGTTDENKLLLSGTDSGKNIYNLTLNPEYKNITSQFLSADFSMTLTLDSNAVFDPDTNLITIGDSGSGIWILKPDINKPDPKDPPPVNENPSVSKSRAATISSTGERIYNTGGIVEFDDYIVYKIELKHPGGSVTRDILIRRIEESFSAGLKHVTNLPASVTARLDTIDLLIVTENSKWVQSDGTGLIWDYNMANTSVRSPFNGTDGYITLTSTDSSYVTYIVLQYDETTKGSSNSLTNDVKIYEGDDGIPGDRVWVTYRDIYDLALTTWIEEIKKDGIIISPNPLPHSDPRPAVAEKSEIKVEYRVLNQGRDVKDVYIYAYVPKGYSLTNDPANSVWTYVGTYPKLSSDGSSWSEIKVYKAKAADDLVRGANDGTVANTNDLASKTPMWLSVDHYIGKEVNSYTYTAEDFYIAGEIYSFKDRDSVTQTDIDSTPAIDDDFTIINGLGIWNDLHKTDAEPSISSKDSKEISGKKDGHAKTSPNDDEDDFDFDFITILQAATDPFEDTGALKKAISVVDASTIGKLFSTATVAALGTKRPATNGIINNLSDSYIVYEIWVNEKGLLDTAGAQFNDYIPDYMKLFSYGPSGSEQYAVRVDKFSPFSETDWGVDNSVNPPVKYITYGDKNYTVSKMNLNLTNAGLQNNTSVFSNSATDDRLLDAEVYGIKSAKYESNVLTIEFDTPLSDSVPNADYERLNTKAAYRITMIVTLDQGFPVNTDVRNQVDYKYGENIINRFETSKVYYTTETSGSIIQKHIVEDLTTTEGRHESNIINSVSTVNASGNMEVSYRLRVTTGSGGNITANTFSFSDNLFQQPELEGDLIGDIAVYIKGSAATAYGSPEANPGNYATYNPTSGIVTVNPTVDIPGGTTVDIIFTVEYTEFKYGSVIKNITPTITTRSFTPLALEIAKLDKDTGDDLSSDSRYEFELYRSPDGISKGSLIATLNAANLDTVFWPIENMDPNLIYNTHGVGYLILEETVAPIGYGGKNGNAPREFVIRYDWDNEGNFTFNKPISNGLPDNVDAQFTDTKVAIGGVNKMGDHMDIENLINTGTLLITKTLIGETESQSVFKVKLVQIGSATPIIVSNSVKATSSRTGLALSTADFDTDGFFNIRHGETITFEKLPLGEYQIVEAAAAYPEDYATRVVTTVTVNGILDHKEIGEGSSTIEITEDNSNDLLKADIYNIEPLKLELHKFDSSNRRTELTGYRFEAFYANNTGGADRNRPVLNIYGERVVFDDPNEIFLIRPDGYSVDTQTAGSVNIVLVETRAPSGYSGNLNNQYPLTITWDANGVLSFEPVPRANPVMYEFGTPIGDVNVLNVYNDRDAGTLTVQKQATNMSNSNSFEIRVTGPNNTRLSAPNGFTASTDGFFYLPVGRTASFAEVEIGAYTIEERTYANQNFTVTMSSSSGTTVQGSSITVNITQQNYADGVSVTVNNSGSTTPQNPQNPQTPQTPETPETPNTPDTPDTQNTQNTQNTQQTDTTPQTPQQANTEVPAPPEFSFDIDTPAGMVSRSASPDAPSIDGSVWDPLFDLFGPMGPAGLLKMETEVPNVARTGDDNNIIVSSIAAVTALAGIGLYFLLRKRKLGKSK